jgi:GT2 family glycosyltransferase
MPREHAPDERTIRVSILIVHYRTYGELAACLDSVRPFPADRIEVIVVDHASDPAAAAQLLGDVPRSG